MTYLDTDTIAEDLGLNARTIQKYCKSNFLPAKSQWVKGKMVYFIDQDEYFSWKIKHFRGVKKGSISRLRSQERELSKGQIKDLIVEWLDWCTTGKLGGRLVGPCTKKKYDYYFNYFLNRLGKNPKLPIISIDNFRKVLGLIPIESYSTRKHVYDVVLSFSKYLVETNRLKQEDREKLKKLKPRRFLPAKKVVLTEDQLNKVIHALESSIGLHKYDQILNLTMIKFLASTGLRAGELCNLKLQDIDLAAGIVHVWLGKGNKNRKVGISLNLKSTLEEYLRERKGNSDYFFTGRLGNKLEPHYVARRFMVIRRRTGIHITPHALRRTFVTINVNRGKPLVHLQIACGHSDIGTTRDYCMTTEDEVIEAMKGW